MADYSYIGSGRIYLRDRSITTVRSFIEVGNCSALDFGVTEDVKELKDFTQPGGGTYNEVRRIQAVEMKMTAHDLNPDNLARAVFGNTAAQTAGTVTDESHVDVKKGQFVPTDLMHAGITTVKVAPSTTKTLGTDYEVRSGGIYIPTGSSIVDGDDLLLTYTKSVGDVIEALLNSAKEWEVFFDGLNEARSGKKTRIRAHRVKMGAAANLSLIGEDYAGLETTGKLLKDTSKNGTSVSQYFVVDIEQ